MTAIRHLLRRWFPYLEDSALFSLGMLVPIGTTVLLCVMVASQARGAEGRWITVEATAYCPCSLCCDERTERTANGTNTNQEPYGVAASRNIPFGTTIFIPLGAGYLDQTYPRDSQRLFTVDDRGSALDSERRRYGLTRLDLRYKSHDFAVRFGRRVIAVYVLAN